MNILEPSGIVESIFGSTIWIELVPVKKGANFVSFLKDVDIDVVGKPSVHPNGNVSIHPRYVSSSHVLDYGIKSSDGEASTKEISVADFRNSQQLYNKLKPKNSPYKILHDRSSFLRAKELYDPISYIEQEIRKKYVKEVGYGKIPEPKGYRKDLPDHKVSQLDLFEILSLELLKPASDHYFTQQIEQGVNIVDARHLTRLDEYDLPFDNAELVRFRSIRNAVMHFRIVTIEDVDFIIKTQSKMYQFGIKELTRDAFIAGAARNQWLATRGT
jgi:hypothetical protein